KPVDKDLYELPPAEQKKIKQLPGALDIVLDNLEKDHEFLLKGDVFTPDLIETWIEYKRKNEVDPVRLRPHPYEFALYYDLSPPGSLLPASGLGATLRVGPGGCCVPGALVRLARRRLPHGQGA